MKERVQTETPVTAKQRRVVLLIAAGYSFEEMGERLGISPRTAKAHSDALRVKLKVKKKRQIPQAYAKLTGEDPYPRVGRES
jgi:DNA-binding CsgD family transcriptional regulator